MLPFQQVLARPASNEPAFLLGRPLGRRCERPGHHIHRSACRRWPVAVAGHAACNRRLCNGAGGPHDSTRQYSDTCASDSLLLFPHQLLSRPGFRVAAAFLVPVSMGFSSTASVDWLVAFDFVACEARLGSASQLTVPSTCGVVHVKATRC